MLTDKEETFSRVPAHYLYIEDMRAYIHARMVEVSHLKFNDLWEKVTKDDNVNLKKDYKNLRDPRLEIWRFFPKFFDEVEWIRVIPS